MTTCVKQIHGQSGSKDYQQKSLTTEKKCKVRQSVELKDCQKQEFFNLI